MNENHGGACEPLLVAQAIDEAAYGNNVIQLCHSAHTGSVNRYQPVLI